MRNKEENSGKGRGEDVSPCKSNFVQRRYEKEALSVISIPTVPYLISCYSLALMSNGVTLNPEFPQLSVHQWELVIFISPTCYEA